MFMPLVNVLSKVLPHRWFHLFCMIITSQECVEVCRLCWIDIFPTLLSALLHLSPGTNNIFVILIGAWSISAWLCPPVNLNRALISRCLETPVKTQCLWQLCNFHIWCMPLLLSCSLPQPILSPLSLPCFSSRTNELSYPRPPVGLRIRTGAAAVKSSCIENIFSAGVETNARPAFFFILTVLKGSIIPPPRTTQSSWRHGGLWSSRVCFCCGVSVSRLMQGKGRIGPILERAGIVESSLGQTLRITLCLMYMKQNSFSSC